MSGVCSLRQPNGLAAKWQQNGLARRIHPTHSKLDQASEESKNANNRNKKGYQEKDQNDALWETGIRTYSMEN